MMIGLMRIVGIEGLLQHNATNENQLLKYRIGLLMIINEEDLDNKQCELGIYYYN